MKPNEKPLTIQDRARLMLRKMEEEAAADPNGALAAHIAMNRIIEEVADKLAAGYDFDEATREALHCEKKPKSNLASGRDSKKNYGCHG